MKSDPPTAQCRSPRRQTGQASGSPKIQPTVQPSSPKPTNQSGSRKRKLVLSDDKGDNAEKTLSKEVTGKQPKQANPKKKTSSVRYPKSGSHPGMSHLAIFSCIVKHFIKISLMAYLESAGSHMTLLHLEKTLNKLTRRLDLRPPKKPGRLTKITRLVISRRLTM